MGDVLSLPARPGGSVFMMKAIPHSLLWLTGFARPVPQYLPLSFNGKWVPPEWRRGYLPAAPSDPTVAAQIAKFIGSANNVESIFAVPALQSGFQQLNAELAANTVQAPIQGDPS